MRGLFLQLAVWEAAYCSALCLLGGWVRCWAVVAQGMSTHEETSWEKTEEERGSLGDSCSATNFQED